MKTVPWALKRRKGRAPTSNSARPAVLPGILSLLICCAAAWAAQPTRFEAENQPLADKAAIIKDPLASCGQAVWFNNSGEIRWQVTAPVAGRYELWLRYRAADGDKVAGFTVNKRELGLGFPYTGEDWGEVKVIRTLSAGRNTIVLRKDWPRLWIDYLRFGTAGCRELRPVVELPVITPRSNTHYLQSPADVRVRLDLRGRRLLRIDDESGRSFDFDTTFCEHLDDAVWVRLPASGLRGLGPGRHRLSLRFDGNIEVPFEIELRAEPAPADWTIVTLDVNHGSATFMRLPGGRTLLLDTAKAEEAAVVLVPFLHDQQVTRLDYLILTHYHDDHAGGLPALTNCVAIGQRWDYRSFKSGDVFDADGVRVTVLNAHADGTEENTRSLALRFEYRGFVYSHGADNYAQNQVRQLAQFPPELLRAHVYCGNHHLHGSIDPGYYRTVDPVLVIVSADQAVYARGAFTTVYQREVEEYLKAANGRLRETLVTEDVGHVVLRITDAGHWTCETTPDRRGLVLGIRP